MAMHIENKFSVVFFFVFFFFHENKKINPTGRINFFYGKTIFDSIVISQRRTQNFLIGEGGLKINMYLLDTELCLKNKVSVLLLLWYW